MAWLAGNKLSSSEERQKEREREALASVGRANELGALTLLAPAPMPRHNAVAVAVKRDRGALRLICNQRARPRELAHAHTHTNQFDHSASLSLRVGSMASPLPPSTIEQLYSIVFVCSQQHEWLVGPHMLGRRKPNSVELGGRVLSPAGPKWSRMKRDGERDCRINSANAQSLFAGLDTGLENQNSSRQTQGQGCGRTESRP